VVELLACWQWKFGCYLVGSFSLLDVVHLAGEKLPEFWGFWKVNSTPEKFLF